MISRFFDPAGIQVCTRCSAKHDPPTMPSQHRFVQIHGLAQGR